jgi:hypothetical protein
MSYLVIFTPVIPALAGMTGVEVVTCHIGIDLEKYRSSFSSILIKRGYT